LDIHFNYTPFDVHIPFHQTSAREKAAIGAVGSGKTIALCADAILLGLQQPGSRILIARQTVPSLRDTTEHEFLSLLNAIPEELEGVQKKSLYDLCEVRRSGGHVDRLMLPNGSEYLFRSLDDWRKLMSLNIAAFYIDEASEIAVESYLGLMTRIRQTEPTQQAQRLGHRTIEKRIAAVCCNPNGHNWVWEYFVNGPTQLRESGLAANVAAANNRRYFRSTSFDNPTLYNPDGSPGDFLQSLLTMPEIWVRRYVLCEFDAFEGQIYEFGQEQHVYDHFDPPQNWERACGLDWGLRNPVAVVWWARDPQTLVWHMYREYQSYDQMNQMERESRVTPTVHEVAAIIKSLEGSEKIRWRVIDPSSHKREADSGKSVHYWLSHYGLHFQNGIQDYSSRINSFNQLLKTRQFKISTSCPQSQIAIQQYRWSDVAAKRDTNAPERPHKHNDHLVNACEYLATIFATARPLDSTPADKTDKEYLHDEIWKTVKKQVQKRNVRNLGNYNYGPR